MGNRTIQLQETIKILRKQVKVLKKKIAEYESENFHKQKVEYEQPYNFAGGDRFTLKDDGATY